MPSLDPYYQPDFSHRPKSSPKPKTSAPQYEIGLNGVPVRVDSASTRKPIPPRVERKPGPWDAGYEKPDNIVMDVIPEAAKDPGRRIYPAPEKRTNPAGVVQTGKNLGGGGTPIDMGRSFNDLLAGVGQKPFSSNQLPGTDTNPFSATSAKTPGFDMSQGDFGGAAAVNFDAEGGVAAIRSKNLQDDQPFNPSAPQIAGGSERISQQATGISSGRLSDALEGVKTQEANREMTDERRQLMARAAFLDGKDSMSGLRAKEAVNGVVYAGGKHYVSGKSGDDKAVEISRPQARSIANNEDTASNISSSELKAQELLKKKSTEIVAATKQSPTVLEESAKTQAFTQDKPQYSSSTPEFGGKIEFEDSNPGSRPGFGNTGEFKSGFKRIDTSMNNPFG